MAFENFKKWLKNLFSFETEESELERMRREKERSSERIES
jgi:hypothetical protein